MSLRSQRRVKAIADDRFELKLPAPERDLLVRLPEQLEALLTGLDEPESSEVMPSTLARLFPPAYTRDEQAEASYAKLTRAELVAGRRKSLSTLASCAQAKTVSAAELEACLGALNDLRLVLGTALEVTEEQPELDEQDPSFPQWICYSYLTFLQNEMVEALSPLLPAEREGADDSVPEDPWGEPLGGLRWDGTPLPKV